MKKIILLKTIAALLLVQQVAAQDCKTNADADAAPGKYLTAAQYPWPAVRGEYFNKMATPADKAMAKQVLGQIEKIEAQSHTAFNLTGGNWENIYSSDGYMYFANSRLGRYSLQSALYEYFCSKGKLVRNTEYSAVLRIYANAIPINTLSNFLYNPFGSIMNGNDFGFQYLDWKNHKSADVNAQLISLFTYISCNSQSLLDAINSGNNYFQDVAEKEIKANNRNNYIYRYWFVKKNDRPVLLPVSRKEYLQSLLEYYEREKLQIPMQIKEYKSIPKQYTGWEADLSDKIAVVKKALSENKEEWLLKQAVINYVADKSQTYKARLTEATNYNRFWKFYDDENKGEPLYKYNPDYFKTTAQSPAKPQIISIVFRYVTIPSSLRMLNNFTKNFDFNALRKMVE
jgi:hypothetical protein